MLNPTEKNRLLCYINGKFDTNYGRKNKEPYFKYFDDLNTIFPTLTEQDVLDYLNDSDKNPLTDFDISQSLNPNRFSSWFIDYQNSKKQQAENDQRSERELQKARLAAANTSLGTLESAMVDIMVNNHAEEFASAVYQDVDKYIHEKYGDITRNVVYHIPECNGSLGSREVTHEKYETVLKFVLANEPVMLVGPAGTGKNVICEQVARNMKLPFYFTGKVTQEYQIKGFIDANGHYHETPFYKAFTEGGVFMLDEIDASIPEALVALNAAIGNRYYDFPCGQKKAHPDFRIMASGNTFGTGASYTYSGRTQLDGASLDRFAVIYIDYDKQIEESLTNDPELVAFIDSFRNACAENGINQIVSYRALKRISKLDHNKIPREELLRICLTKNMEPDDIRSIRGCFSGSSNPWAKVYVTLCDTVRSHTAY